MRIDKDTLNAEDRKYLDGRENWLIRMYYYLSSGLDILNSFRNLFLGIISLYLILKLDNYLWLFAMAIPSMLILMVVGHYNTHKLSKIREWLSTRFSTHYGIRNFNYTEKQVQLLEDIKKLLEEMPKK